MSEEAAIGKPDEIAQALSGVRFWDRAIEDLLEGGKPPEIDAALQIRAEAEELARWIASEKIRSYLEIGIWTGRLLSAFQQHFNFERSGACDLELAKAHGLEISLPEGALFFRGNARSPIFFNWVQLKGPFELVFVDAQRDEQFARQMFEQQRLVGAKHIAFSGIAPGVRGETGVRDFWRSLRGRKHEIIRPHAEIGKKESTIGIGIFSF